MIIKLSSFDLINSQDILNPFCVDGLPTKYSDHSFKIGYLQWINDAHINAYQVGTVMYFNQAEDRTLFLLQFAGTDYD